MTTIVCDDVRREEGNKLSYMGIYGASLVVPTFPVTLPKLCFVMSVLCSGNEKPPKRLSFRLYKDADVLTELTLPQAAFKVARAQAQKDATRDAKRFTFGTVLQVYPLQLTGPCILKARALCDDEELTGGAWSVEAAAS